MERHPSTWNSGSANVSSVTDVASTSNTRLSIAFVRGEGRERELFLLDDNGETRQLTDNHRCERSPTWSPDGTTIAYVISSSCTPYRYGIGSSGIAMRGDAALWLVDPDGHERRLIGPDEYDDPDPGEGLGSFIRLVWGPEGEALYLENLGWVTSHQIWRVPRDGSTTKLWDGGMDLQAIPGMRSFGLWQRLYFRNGGSHEAYVVNPDGQYLLHYEAIHDFDPFYFAPNGRKVLFNTVDRLDDDDPWQEGLYLLDLDRGNFQRLLDADASRHARFETDTDPEALPFRWDPASRRVLYVTDIDGDTEIHVLDTGTGDDHQLTQNGIADHSPVWSPDGRQIAFVSERDGNPEIYTVNIDGSELTRRTHDPAPDVAPRWRPASEEQGHERSRTAQ